MDDGDTGKNMEKNISGKSISNIFNVGAFFQSIRVRCGSVFSDITNRKFMEGELRLVLYCGSILWILYLLSKII
jgi:hypothetical protein